jgi:hypothetical protein
VRKAFLAIAFIQLGFASYVFAGDERVVLKQMRLLNQIPETQLSDKTDPAFSILRSLYDEDGPDFLTLRRLLGRADIRARLNPSVRCVLGGVISQRWDAFALSGNLYLAGLRSPNPDLRDKARKKLVAFIQKQHIPELIELLKSPGPNVLAYEILQEPPERNSIRMSRSGGNGGRGLRSRSISRATCSTIPAKNCRAREFARLTRNGFGIYRRAWRTRKRR